ncbi:MAG: hypothetical protein ACXVRD_06345 [Gaiellaceae bacterium]
MEATIFPKTDDDWYQLVDTDLSDSFVDLYAGRGETLMTIWEDGNIVADHVTSYEVADSGQHNWKVHVFSTKADVYGVVFNDSPPSAIGRPAKASLARSMPKYLRVHG